VSASLDFKAKYARQWGHSNKRERIALDWLDYLGIEAVPKGHGTLSPGVLDGYHSGPEDKFDLYAPALGLWFEITGTDWRKVDSAKRYSKAGLKPAVLAVLKAKVDLAEYYGLENWLWFVSVNGIQGEVRFLPCPEVKRFPLTHYAAGEGAYYAVPWDYWWPPFRALPSFAKRRMEACPIPA